MIDHRSTESEAFLATHNVSRETIQRLELYESLLIRWQKIKNLVAKSTLEHLWIRHFADSMQLLEHGEGARRWLDVGSGAGFPGMVLAIALAEQPLSSVILVESDNRKCAFLREVARLTRSPAQVVHGRVEEVIKDMQDIEIVTARALAPMAKLLSMCQPVLEKGAQGLFLKGQDIVSELTDDPIFSKFDIGFAPSVTDGGGRIVNVRWRG